MQNVMLDEEGLSQDDDLVINSYNYSWGIPFGSEVLG